MTDAEFDFLRAFLRQKSAIVLEADKRYLVEARLGPVLRKLGESSISNLVGRLRANPANGVATQIINALVTSETSFFRDLVPFETLRKQLLPELIAARSGERRLAIWSAACSTGQEPYTIAMTIRESFPELAHWRVTILATDLSTDVIAKAKEGRYSQFEANRGLPAKLMVKYFHQHGTTWEMDSSIRSMVEFRTMNLAEPWPAMPSFDLIFLRNVMIYFDVETKRAILSRVVNVLRPDGYLVLGGAETTIGLSSEFERVERLKGGYYQRIAMKLS